MATSKPSKKVLIITYYWPPSGGIGVLRCLKFAKYLRDYGWEPVIYTAKDAHYPTIDHSNDKDVPEGIEIIKRPIIEPYTFYKMLTGQKKTANVNNVFYTLDKNPGLLHRFSIWIRSNFFIPDARALWIQPSVKHLTKYLAQNPVEAMITCGPPHTNTRIATLLKKKTGTPWLMDFQDPWTQVDYYKLLSLTSWGNRKHHKLEREALAAADKTTIVSPTWKRDLEKIGGQNISVHYWGYDPEDYQDLPFEKNTKFSLSHIGILGYDRNPKIFFEAIQEICTELDGFDRDFELVLVGQVDYSVIEAYTSMGLDKYILLLGLVPRKEALEIIASSTILLLLLNQQENAKGRVPGKLFEYLAVRKTIFCLGAAKGDVAHIISKSDSGITLEYENRVAIKEYIVQKYQEWKNGALDKPILSNIEEYSHPNLTRKLAQYLDKISGRS